MNKLREIVDDTIQVLEHMKKSGTTHVEVSKQTLDELSKAPVVVRAKASQPTGNLATLESKVKACTKCSELAQCRKNVVFGVGNIHAELMFVGEAPGADEDEQGEPFVGRAGQFLTKIIEAMGYQRSDIYLSLIHI